MVGLAACAQLPPGTIARTPPTLTHFELDGRIVVRQSQSRHHAASIHWRHEPARDRVLLSTPLGQGIAELTRGADGARLVMADGREYRAADWESLAGQLFGARLPLDALPDWITGHAPPVSAGWQVEYLDYQSDAADALPVLIEAKGGDIELRLKVDTWSAAR